MTAHQPQNDTSALINATDGTGHGGKVATVLSAMALGFSGLSFYESVMKTADLNIYVPPVIHYARDAGGDVELFAIPLTISNIGARTGTVLSIELEAENLKAGAEPKTKRYYSAFLGEHPRKDDDTSRSFAPISIAGRETFSNTVRFYPAGNPLPKLIEEEGDYRFTLQINTAAPTGGDLWQKSAKPLSFQMTLPWISDQQLGSRRTAIAMHAKDWKPTTSGTAP